ncbi:MAG: prepilin-type N-terminal cleavage/methylation domain-containing protein [Phycisphaeraceae bacterium]|nr:prepilin-type N-terminal cleavage/methylation domain-containing protein [Phycisphaeraceae bacterium]
MRSPTTRAFTLVEILIVVVILGILAAIVIPAFNSTVGDSAATTTYSELQKLRRHVGVYKARHADALPNVVAGDGSWGELVSADHFLAPPVNAWVGGANSRVIVVMPNAVPDAAYHTAYGWIYDPVNGDIFAAGFDSNDNPLPRP